VIASFDLMYDYHISVVYYAQFFQGYNTPGRNASDLVAKVTLTKEQSLQSLGRGRTIIFPVLGFSGEVKQL